VTDCVDLALRTLNPPDIRIESVDQTGKPQGILQVSRCLPLSHLRVARKLLPLGAVGSQRSSMLQLLL